MAGIVSGGMWECSHNALIKEEHTRCVKVKMAFQTGKRRGLENESNPGCLVESIGHESMQTVELFGEMMSITIVELLGLLDCGL